MAKPKHPKRILVSLQNAGGDDEYLDAVYAEDELADDRFEDGEQIGVYELEEVKRLKKPVLLQ